MQKLLELYALRNENWVTELWLDDMYLRNQVPLPVNSNPAFLLPRQKFDNHLEMLWFAAHFIKFIKLFNDKIQTQQLEQDMIVKRTHKPSIQSTKINDLNNNQILVNNNNVKIAAINATSNGINQEVLNQQPPVPVNPISKQIKQPLCMQTYRHIFRAYRRPGDEKDYQIINQDIKYDHIVIACADQFFALSLTVDENEKNPEMFVEYIYSKLLAIWEFCSKLKNSKDKSLRQKPVGLYTTEHRRTWWQIRNNLIKSIISKFKVFF